MDRSDYYFGGADGKARQFSRKQAGELLSDIDDAERQLRDYYDQADENYQIVEGIISEVPLTRKRKSDVVTIRPGAQPGRMFSYKVAAGGFLYSEHTWEVSSSMLDAWMFSLSQVGVITFFTENYIRTAKLLAAIYHNCQKVNHTTLQRYIKPRIHLQDVEPIVKALVRLSAVYKLGIGEEKAKAIADYGYSSILDLTYANIKELCEVDGIGKVVASKLLQALGREDV